MKRRLLSLVMAAGLLVSLITGCGKSEASSEKKVTIIFGDQVANVEESSKYLWDVAQEFMKKNPDITIEFQGSDHEDYISKLKMATQSDSLPDVFGLNLVCCRNSLRMDIYTILQKMPRQGVLWTDFRMVC